VVMVLQGDRADPDRLHMLGKSKQYVTVAT
jgi:hypothetical protein